MVIGRVVWHAVPLPMHETREQCGDCILQVPKQDVPKIRRGDQADQKTSNNMYFAAVPHGSKIS